jgi:hypothetical protein
MLALRPFQALGQPPCVLPEDKFNSTCLAVNYDATLTQAGAGIAARCGVSDAPQHMHARSIWSLRCVIARDTIAQVLTSPKRIKMLCSDMSTHLRVALS